MKGSKIFASFVGATMIFTSTIPAYARTLPSYSYQQVMKQAGLKSTELQFDELNDNYEKVDGGIRGHGKGDQFLYSNTEAKDFVYEADVKFNEKKGAASLVFRAQGKYSYVANLNGETGHVVVFKFGDPADLGPSKDLKVKDSNTYHLKVVAIGNHIVYYVDDQLVLNSADYTMSNGHWGQDDSLTEGKLGLLTWESDVTYSNIKYATITDDNSPQLNGIKLNAVDGGIDKDILFQKGQYVYIANVKHDTHAVKLDLDKNEGTTVTAYNEEGNPVDYSEGLPITKDMQTYTLKATNGSAEVVYRLRLHRCQKDETYYNEKWRGQFHYSIKDGWANDPNGMVYFKGEWHLFHQYYDGDKWGPMHWMHATSKDGIHWEEHPIAFYPDEYGTMYSGCAVIANHETAPDIFKEGEEGLVFLITANGNNGNDDQKIIGAYSLDGKTFHKYEKGKVLIHWKEDSLNTSAFRDPKVFRYDNKWFMVVAGGPLRIYSSDDLVHWNQESAYKDCHTECPDLFPVVVRDENGKDTGEVKWVFSRGGRKYKIGDFKKVDGKYKFVPLSQYASENGEGMGDEKNDGIMNFGYDSYAAMTYYTGEFGSGNSYNKSVVDNVIAVNWMNTWEGGFCNSIPDKNGNSVFNGTFNLALKMGIKKTGDNYELTQTPIKEYDDLKEETKEYKDVKLTKKNTAFNDFRSSSYVINAHVDPKDSKEVTFKVRASDKEGTLVTYNFDTETLTIDRSNSGVIVNGDMNNVSHKVKKNKDGSVDLEIYVDRSSVEVFNNDYTVEGAMQIFPGTKSNGLQIYSDKNAIGNVKVTPLKSIWTNKQTLTKPNGIECDTDHIDGYVNQSYEVNTDLAPEDIKQDVVYEAVEGKDLIKIKQEGTKATITCLKKGKAKVRVYAKADPSYSKEITIDIKENNLKTNVNVFEPDEGKWYIDGDQYVGEYEDGESTLYSEYIRNKDFDYQVKANWKDTEEVSFIVKSQKKGKGGAWKVTIDASGNIVVKDTKDNAVIANGKASVTRNDLVKISVRDHHLMIYINGKKAIDTKVSNDHFYANGYVGIGFNVGTLRISEYYVYETPDRIVLDADGIHPRANASLDEIKKLLPKTVKLAGSDNLITEENVPVTWDVSKLNVKKPGTYIVVGKARQLTVSIKVYIKIKDARLEKVKISKAKAKKKSIKLSWKKIKNVKTYEVAYRKKGTKKWRYKKVSRTSLTIKKLKSRKTYEVKVRTVVGKQKGTFSSIKKVKVK